MLNPDYEGPAVGETDHAPVGHDLLTYPSTQEVAA